jgi:hypothetical protein
MPNRHLLTAAAVACLALAAIPAAADFVTTPSTVLQFVPFRVSDPTSIRTAVRVMGSADCGATLAGGSRTALSSGSAVFTITADTTSVWLCDGDANTMIRAISINPMSSTPVFAVRNAPTTLTYSAVTPIGAAFRLMTFADCSNSASSIATGVINSFRQVTITASTTGFKCVTVTNEAQGGDFTVNTGRLLVTEAIGFSPMSVIFSDQVTFQISGAAPAGANVRVSLAADCSGTTKTYTATGAFGTTIQTTVDIPRGQYQFCIELSSGVYASAGTLQVLQYRATPTTAMRTRSTVFTLLPDAPFNTAAIISANQGCTNPIFGPLSPSTTTGQLPAVTFTALGTYFVCVQTPADPNKYISATSVLVVPPADVTFSPDPIVRGLLNTLNAQPDAAMTVRLSVVGDCANVYNVLTTAANAATIVLPTTGANSSVTVMQVCVVTSDGSAVYPMRTVDIRAFTFSHEALLARPQRNLTLDAATPLNTNFFLSRNTACSDQYGPTYTVTSASRTVFVDVVDAATYSVCIRSTSSITSNVGAIVVNPVPTFAPNASLTRQATTVQFQNAIAGARFIIGTTCTLNILATGAATGNTISLVATFPTNGVYQVCAVYLTSDNRDQTFLLGTINVADVVSSPRYHVRNIASSLTFAIPNADPSLSSSINSNFFLTTAADCTTVTGTTTIPVVNGVANFTPSALGNFTVCVQAVSPVSGGGPLPYVPAGFIEIVDSPTVGIVQSYGVLYRIPFNVNMSRPYIPTGFVVTDGVNACRGNLLATGNFNPLTGLSASQITLTNATAVYTLCVRSPDANSLLFSRTLTAPAFTSRITSLVEAQPATVVTLPVLTPATFRLSADIECDPNAAFFVVANGTVLTAPAGVYRLCAVGAGTPPAFIAPSNNSVSVIASFTAVIPDSIRGSVPVTIDVASDNTGQLRVYLLLNRGRTCNILTDVPLVGFTSATASTVEITVPARTNVTVCAISRDGTVAMSVGSITPLPYTTPAEIVKGTTTTVRTGLTRNGVVRLTTDALCQLAVGNSLRSLVDFNVADILIPTSVTSTTLHWCEAPSLSNLAFTRMDTIGLLEPLVPGVGTPPPLTPPPNSTWTPPPGLFPPGVPFNISVPDGQGTNPFLSRFHNCSDNVSYVFGIFPREGEFVSLFVCATSSAGTVYTTLYPTLNFSNFALEPVVATTLSPTRVNVLPGISRFIDAGRDGVWFAKDAECSVGLFGPVATGADLVTFPSYNRTWVCLAPNRTVARYVGVASLMVHAPATAAVYPGRLRAVPVCLNLTVPSGTWSIVRGVDPPTASPNQERKLYLTVDSNLPLSTTSTIACGSEIAGTALEITRSNGSFCLPTAALASGVSYAVCGPTPVSNVLVARGLQFPTALVVPLNFVVDSRTAINVAPNVSGATLRLATAGSACQTAVAPEVTTDAAGNAVVNLELSVAFRPPTYPVFIAGAYDLCLYDPISSSYGAISSVQLTSPVGYGISVRPSPRLSRPRSVCKATCASRRSWASRKQSTAAVRRRTTLPRSAHMRPTARAPMFATASTRTKRSTSAPARPSTIPSLRSRPSSS